MDPEDVDYKCTLTEYSLQKAITKMNEDPKQRLGAVQTLRKWIREQPHYTCRTDTIYLLAILRRAKFSQLMARVLIDDIMTAQAIFPDYMANLDLHDPSMLAFLEAGVTIFLPKPDKEGRRILLIRPAAKDLDDPKFSPVNDVRFSLAMTEMFRDSDENDVVNGHVLVFDYTGVKMKHVTHGSTDHNKKMTRIYQDCVPEQTKAFFFFNAGTIFEAMVSLMKLFVNKKNQERIQLHDTMDTLYKVIPMELWPDEYLPADYKGPSVGSVASIIAQTKKRVMDPEVRDRVLANTSDKYRLDESKRMLDVNHNESFRKLSID